jgi:hypothetical protein
LQGGVNPSGTFGGNGGGGGYFGGGTGASDFGCQADLAGAGGGSGFIGGTGVSNATTTAGSGTTPPDQGDTSYVAGVGVGGSPHTVGGNGLVVITW